MYLRKRLFSLLARTLPRSVQREEDEFMLLLLFTTRTLLGNLLNDLS